MSDVLIRFSNFTVARVNRPLKPTPNKSVKK